jgi:putative transposase
MFVVKTFKYRLYPTRTQVAALRSQLDGHRFLYNCALAQRKEYYEKTGTGIGYSTQATTLLPKLRTEHAGIATCNYSSCQQTLRRLDKAFTAFFRRSRSGEVPGYPRFKSADRFNTIAYAVLGDGCQIRDGRLYLQNIGHVKVKWHRPLDGKVKTLSISRRTGKWYVSCSVDCEAAALPATGKAVGIDVGLTSFLTTSDGCRVDAPHYFRASERKLKVAQQCLSRRQKGSRRRATARSLVARLHEKVANQRLDFCHKTAHALVRAYDHIVVENLTIRNLVKNPYLAKSISDAGWGMFLTILKGKAVNAGRSFEDVAPAGTSQRCSACGEVVKKSLSVRVHRCPWCSLSLDRDVNAALNILARTGPSALTTSSVAPPRSRLL